MKRSHSSRRPRAGFTLIELLVVIAIIAVLVSLTAAGVMRVLVKGPETQTRTEISQLDAAAAAFQQEFGVDYIPSVMRIHEDGAWNLGDPLEAASFAYLQKLFKNGVGVGVKNDWNGDGNATAGPITLQGQHCLVLFLGGVGGVQGFSTNPANPTLPGGTRKGPYFPFQTSRLVPDPSAGNFPVYVDPWKKGKPYAYFSHNKQLNGYSLTDCAGLGVQPYYHVQGNIPMYFENPQGHQIISAGQDGAFGPGGPWVPGTGVTAGPGADDQSNFARGLLKAGQ